MKLKIEFEKLWETVIKHTELTIKNTTDALIEKLTSMQNTQEQKTDSQLKTLEDQISKLLNVMMNTPRSRPNQT